jgi:uncharacterized membrane protein YeaQ/YmgE (transglycosylase-associated protein family)
MVEVSSQYPLLFLKHKTRNEKVKYSGERDMNIIAWIVLGLIAGAIAKAIYPGTQGGGFLATTALGIVGAFVGGYLSQFLPGVGAAAVGAFTIPSIISAVVGAIVVLFIWGLLTQRAA